MLRRLSFASMTFALIACGRVGFEEGALRSDAGGDSRDTGSTMDGQVAVDSGAVGDSQPSLDSSMSVDSGSALDSSIPVDTGAAVDTGGPDTGPSARESCCTAWCQDGDRFGPGPTVDSESFTASAPGCTSSTGCTCTISAWIANTWTIVTGNICDAHDFADSCPGSCDGTQCPVIEIIGRLDGATDTCVCVGTNRVTRAAQDVWDSDCAENATNTPFLDACPMP